MYSKLSSGIFFVLSMSLYASACEGECIVDITNAFRGNYSSPIHTVLLDIATQISNRLLPQSHRPHDPMTLVQPIVAAYNTVSYSSLETAIFPSYFHGKCQRFSKDGQDPPGCPNPDCPVVCGTPGSMAHFYPTLRFIAFNNTRGVLKELTDPKSKTFKQIQQKIDDASHCGTTQKMCKRRTRSVKFSASKDQRRTIKRNIFEREAALSDPVVHPSWTHGQAGISKRGSTTSDLAEILAQVGPLLEKTCGGRADNTTKGLPLCSWEARMKAFILSFP